MTRQWMSVTAATGTVVIHLIDSVSARQESGWAFTGAMLLGFATAGFAGLFPSLPQHMRALLCAGLGLLWGLGAVVHHAIPMAVRGPEAADYTGLLVVCGSTAMLLAARRGSKRSVFKAVAVGAVAAVALTACSKSPIEPDAHRTARFPIELTMVVADHTLEFADRVDSTPVAVKVESEAGPPPPVIFARLNDGVTQSRVESALKRGFPAFFPLITPAGSTPIDPGSPSEVTLDLPDGSYVAVSDPLKKFSPAFFEVATSGRSTTVPAADASVEVGEYFIKMPDQIASGTNTIRIDNVGGIGHEVLILTDGKQVTGALAPPPGGKSWVEFDLKPGSYTVVCRIPQLETGKSHQQLGMKTSFTVE